MNNAAERNQKAENSFTHLQFEVNKPLRTRHKLLTREEEVDLCMIYQGKCDGDPAAALDTLTRHNQGLIAKLANKHSDDVHFPFDDALTEATIGFMVACQKFDPERNCRLATVAVTWMGQRLLRERHNQTGVIRIPIHAIEEHKALQKRLSVLAHEFGREPTESEVVDSLGISVERYRWLRNLPMNCLSIDAKVGLGPGLGEWGGDGEYLVDRIADPEQSTNTNTDEFAANFDIRVVAAGLLSILPNVKELEVIQRRFGFDPYSRAQTFQEVAQAMGISRQRVQQIEVKAIKRIRMAFGLPPCLEEDASDRRSERVSKRPMNIPDLMERNDNILADLERGMTYWAVSDKYCLGLSRVRQCFQEARRRRKGR